MLLERIFRNRVYQLRYWAHTHDLLFHQNDDEDFLSEMAAFPLGQRGQRAQVSNSVEFMPVDSIEEIRVMDYKYKEKRKNDTRIFKQSVFYLRCDDLNLPYMSIRPMKWGDRIGRLFGKQVQPFEDHAGFSRLYSVHGEDYNLINSSLTYGFLDYFANKKDLCFEGFGGRYILYRHGQKKRPKQIVDLYNEGMDVFNLLLGKATTGEYV